MNYENEILKIKKKRSRVMGLLIAVEILILIFTSPVNIMIADKVIVDYQGMPFIVTLILMFICFVVGAFAYTAVSMPVYYAMDREADPEKQLVMNMQLNKNAKRNEDIYASDYLYLGIYPKAIEYSEMMIANKNVRVHLSGIFNKARSQFFMENYEGFFESVAAYKESLANADKMNEKYKEAYLKIDTMLDFMCAIANNDTDKMTSMKDNVSVWSASKPAEGFVNYIKGLAANKLGDREEAIYRFKLVKESCPKIVFAKYAMEQLLDMN